jgi:hypothetical protein
MEGINDSEGPFAKSQSGGTGRHCSSGAASTINGKVIKKRDIEVDSD